MSWENCFTQVVFAFYHLSIFLFGSFNVRHDPHSKQGFGLLWVMEYDDQRCLGLFLLVLKRHRQKLLKNTATQAHPQRTSTTFFSPITPNATSQSRDTQIASRPGHNKGVTIDRAIAILDWPLLEIFP